MPLRKQGLFCYARPPFRCPHRCEIFRGDALRRFRAWDSRQGRPLSPAGGSSPSFFSLWMCPVPGLSGLFLHSGRQENARTGGIVYCRCTFAAVLCISKQLIPTPGRKVDVPSVSRGRLTVPEAGALRLETAAVIMTGKDHFQLFPAGAALPPAAVDGKFCRASAVIDKRDDPSDLLCLQQVCVSAMLTENTHAVSPDFSWSIPPLPIKEKPRRSGAFEC